MLCGITIIVNTIFLVASPSVEYDVGDFKKFGAMKVTQDVPLSNMVNHKCRVMAFGIYVGYEWIPRLKRGKEAGLCYGREGIRISNDGIYFRKGSFDCEIFNCN